MVIKKQSHVLQGDILSFTLHNSYFLYQKNWFGGSDENKFLATCSLDKSIKLWKDEKCIESLEEHQDWLRCLSISKDNMKMLSGCVSSNVYGWDLDSRKVTFRINNNKDSKNINTINALGFKSNSSEFLVGTRDSIVKLYDIRDSKTPTIQFYSHSKKLNSACYSENNYNVLTSGRDSSIRLWDLRYMPTFNQDSIQSEVKGYVQEYAKHRCEGYNIPSFYMNNEDSIITGSEDSRIIIYNTYTGEIETQYYVNNQIAHIAQPRSLSSKYEFAYSCTQESDIFFCGPSLSSEALKKEKENQKKRVAKSKKGDKSVNEFQQLMQDHGDFILSIFHKNNFTYSQPLSWANVLTMALKDEENHAQSLQVIQKIMTTLVKTQTQYEDDQYDQQDIADDLEEQNQDFKQFNNEEYKNRFMYFEEEDQYNNEYNNCDICMQNCFKQRQLKRQFKELLQKPTNNYLLDFLFSDN